MNPLIKASTKSELAERATRVLRAGNPNAMAINPNQLTSSVLRSDTLTVSGQNYQGISFNYSKPNPNASEILLQINDLFIATHIRLSAKKLTAASTDTLQGQAQEFTYPNTYVFDGTTEVLAIFALWNATLTFRQNTDVAFPKLWTGDLKFAPDSQYGSPTGINATPTTVRVLTDSKNGPLYGWFGLEPIVMKGTDQLQAALQLPGAQNLTETNEYNYFTISFKGYLVSGVNN